MKTEIMLAYHNDRAVKLQYLERVRAHRAADQLVQNYGYWLDGKGCAVGCTVHGESHQAYEVEMGIPRKIARLEDGIFEGLDRERAMQWPEQFLEAVPVGADLSQVADQFLHWLLVDETDGVIRFAKTEKTKAAIQRVGDLYARKIKGETVELKDWQAARSASASDASASDASDASASDAYADAASAYAAYADAAYADAAYAASSAAAAAAAYAAYAAAAAAYASAAYASAAYAARIKARQRQAEKLLGLLRAAPVPNPQYSN